MPTEMQNKNLRKNNNRMSKPMLKALKKNKSRREKTGSY